MIQLGDRREITHTEASVDVLNGERSISGCMPTIDVVLLIKVINDLLGTTNVAGCAVAQQHRVLTWRCCQEVGIERQEAIDPVRRNAQMLGDQFRRRFWDISVYVLRFLTRLNNQLQ